MNAKVNTKPADSTPAATTVVESFAGIELKGRKDPKAVIVEAKSKSQAIRALASANYTHSEIAKMSVQLPLLQYVDNGKIRMQADGKTPAPIRYQHVRNVLAQPVGAKA